MPASERRLRLPTTDDGTTPEQPVVPVEVTDRSHLKFVLLRIVGDFFVIVAGVMVALAGDSWREERAEVVQEKEYLHRIAIDLERSLRRFDTARVALQRTERHGLAVLPAFRGDRSNTNAAAFLASAYWASRPAMSTTIDDSYADLLSHGGLRLITDDSLRGQIMYYYRRLDGGSLPGIVISDNIGYRSAIRSVIPFEIQMAIRKHCEPNDEPLSCAVALDEKLSQRALQNIRDDEKMELALNIWLQSIEQEIRRLDAVETRTRFLLGVIHRKGDL